MYYVPGTLPEPLDTSKTYAEPESLPLSSSRYAPTMAVSPFAETAVTQKDGTTIYSTNYAYDLVGNRRFIDETSLQEDDTVVTRNLVYGYDYQYRLTSESWKGESYGYTYDLAGNRLTMEHDQIVTTYTCDDLNRLLTATTGDRAVTYGYDANGNRESKAVDEDGDGVTDKLTEYAYDVNDRLLSVDIDGATVFQATYDYRTRRLTKTGSGETTSDPRRLRPSAPRSRDHRVRGMSP